MAVLKKQSKPQNRKITMRNRKTAVRKERTKHLAGETTVHKIQAEPKEFEKNGAHETSRTPSPENNCVKITNWNHIAVNQQG